ncbi:MAG: TRAP transporter small permease subunit, partial [Alphaproteobacteria bacterium]|nr:TRAP transporter small permease subunit [Alphaproteobacteria bacterium]
MRISVVYDLAQPQIRKVLDLLNSILIVIFLVLLTYTTIDQAIPSLEVMETSAHAWDVPIPAFLKTVLVVGSALMLLQALVHLWAQIRRFV